ncbi:helix-turn-helix domain-containing protein [uncultured Enterococcus sp.]|uniref:Rgg/GadR/MutR family transcriptional regulator n=1 Tax=uncultured Enterococcus sp. TaxID=167972 RepID=UPI002AA79122|nr:helix-turn-helix domain-containing protein [uncultured Enterococcus sp.]
MESTGKIFKKIREEKNLSVKETAADIVTTQFLGKYESGNSDIRFTNLLQLLSRMNVTTEEFLAHITDNMDTWLVKVEQELDYAFNAGNSFLMKKFIEKQETEYTETKDSKYKYVADIGKKYYNYLFFQLYTVDLTEIKEYLRQTEQWGKFELFLLTYSGSLFEVEEMFLYGKLLLKRNSVSITINQWRCDAVLHIILELLRQSELQKADSLLNTYLSKLTGDREFYYIHYDLFARFIHGLLLIRKSDLAGAKECQKIIEIFSDTLGYADYANRLNTLFDYHQSV